jgi:Cytidylate kinase-like family
VCRHVPRSVVCISRAWGAAGEEIGRLVAERLGFLFVDEELISRAAERGGVDPETVADAERRKSLFAGMLDYLAQGSAAVVATAPMPPPSDEPPSEAVREFIRDAIHEVAERGNVVIVAHAASHAIGAGPKALRVLVTAPPETRSERLAVADGLEADDAVRAIRRSDADRADYLKRFYGVKEELPTHYDLVINTDTLSVDQAAALIVQAAADRPSA